MGPRSALRMRALSVARLIGFSKAIEKGVDLKPGGGAGRYFQTDTRRGRRESKAQRDRGIIDRRLVVLTNLRRSGGAWLRHRYFFARWQAIDGALQDA